MMQTATLTLRPRFAWWVRSALAAVFVLGRVLPGRVDRAIDVVIDRGMVLEPK